MPLVTHKKQLCAAMCGHLKGATLWPRSIQIDASFSQRGRMVSFAVYFAEKTKFLMPLARFDAMNGPNILPMRLK